MWERLGFLVVVVPLPRPTQTSGSAPSPIRDAHFNSVMMIHTRTAETRFAYCSDLAALSDDHLVFFLNVDVSSRY